MRELTRNDKYLHESGFLTCDTNEDTNDVEFINASVLRIV